MAFQQYSETEALNAIKANPGKVLTLTKKKDAKSFKGTFYIDMSYRIKPNVAPSGNQGWFTFRNAHLSQGITNKLEVRQGSPDEHEGFRLQVRCYKSQMGPIGEFLAMLDKDYQDAVKAMIAANELVIGKRDIHGLIQTSTGPNNKKNPNALLEDPVISMHIGFDKYPDKFPVKHLQNVQKTTFLDFNKPYTVEVNGKKTVKYEEATVLNKDGKPERLNADNVHQFIKATSRIVFGRIHIPSVCVSQAWVSCPISAQELIIESGMDEGFPDEEIEPPTDNTTDNTAGSDGNVDQAVHLNDDDLAQLGL